jgi:hypothetical protein
MPLHGYPASIDDAQDEEKSLMALRKEPQPELVEGRTTEFQPNAIPPASKRRERFKLQASS